MEKVSVKLDKREARRHSNGAYPIVLYLHHKKGSRRINLKYAFQESEWNEEKIQPIGVPNDKLIGVKIRSQLSTAEQLIQSLELEVDGLSIGELKARIEAEIFAMSSTRPSVNKQYVKRATNKESFTHRAQLKIARLEESKKFGNKSAVNTAYNALKTYFGFKPSDTHENILFVDIDYNTLQNFCAYLYGKKCTSNTIRAYLAQIRALFNEAIVAKELDKDVYPFDGFKMPKSPKTKKRSLRIEDIQKIRELDLEKESYLWKARNYFLFMFNNMGINFIDLVQIKKSQFSQTEYDLDGNLTAGRITYARNKTEREFSVKLTQESLDILNNYSIRSKQTNDYTFPYGFENTEDGRKRYEQHRKTVNGHLKKIAKLAKIDEDITTYFALHTWATIAKRNNFPITLISEALGHADTKTTETYLASFDSDVLDAANESVTGSC